MIRRAAVVLVVCGPLISSLAACGGEGAAHPTPSRGDPISVAPDDPSLPYGIVAIDYHFHDAHPSRSLAPTRPVVFSNQGTLKHNVTFPQLSFSRDLEPGDRITIRDLGSKLGGLGVYTFFCAYHDAFGMVGTIVVA